MYSKFRGTKDLPHLDDNKTLYYFIACSVIMLVLNFFNFTKSTLRFVYTFNHEKINFFFIATFSFACWKIYRRCN